MENPTGSQSVRVAVNIRPLVTPELLVGCSDCISVTPGEPQVKIGAQSFTFDYVYGSTGSASSRIFDDCVAPLVDVLFHGYNATVLAYGQTGSGKTYTMGTNYNGECTNGIIPKVMETIFRHVEETKGNTEYLIRASFIEIYKEEVFDLLESSTVVYSKGDGNGKGTWPSRAPIQIREMPNGGISLAGVTEAEVTSQEEMASFLLRGSLCRATGSTNMNSQSSRSHAIFTISIEQKRAAGGTSGGGHDDVGDDILSAKLHLVDLAGSEGAKKTGADGMRLREGIQINKGLLALGNVISALGDDKKRKEGGHVPYRDSKLTRLLQDSLGGNSKTVMIACVSPADTNAEETLNTLKYANRARNIQNKAIVNRDPVTAQMQMMKNQIEQLQAELLYVKGDSSTPFEGLQKKEYEVALVGAFRREKDKDITVQALTAETQAALQLAKQREDEILGLKMRLRFRESAMERLEGVASGKISAEAHLLKEKEEHLKELEVLRSQVDRNQEVTRFAMENLRLKEEIKRLKSFYEEGEQERMNEQIMILEKKLLEALDWKLMHESEPSQEDPATPCQTMVDAIAAASQREAEAHETAIRLSKENNELRVKLKMLIDDNNKLSELYEGAVADSQQNISRGEESQRDHVDQTEFVQKELEMKRENDKLLGLYEKAMQERDELKRLISSGGLETRDAEANCDLLCEPHELFDGKNLVEANVLDEHSHCSSPRTDNFEDEEKELEHNETKELDKRLEQKEAEMKRVAGGDTSVLKQHYEKKVQDLEQEKRNLQVKLDKRLEQKEAEMKRVAGGDTSVLKQHYEKKVQDLEQEKRNLRVAGGDTSVLKQHYEKKVQDLEQEKRNLQKEIEQPRCNLANISSTSDDSIQKLKENYLQKLNFLESQVIQFQVAELKKKLDAQAQQKRKTEKAVKKLRSEIHRIKTIKSTEKLRTRIAELTRQQKKILYASYENNQNPSKEERKELANFLSLPLRVITKWYADTRGRKKRKKN